MSFSPFFSPVSALVYNFLSYKIPGATRNSVLKIVTSLNRGLLQFLTKINLLFFELSHDEYIIYIFCFSAAPFIQNWNIKGWTCAIFHQRRPGENAFFAKCHLLTWKMIYLDIATRNVSKLGNFSRYIKFSEDQESFITFLYCYLLLA